MASTQAVPTTVAELRAVLAAIGATPAAVDAIVSGADEATLETAVPGCRSALEILEDLVAAAAGVGHAAHDLMGHVPNGGASRPAAPPTSDGLRLQLRFLREHIVSTIDQQGAAVWWTPDQFGRPLASHAVALVARDRELLPELERSLALAMGSSADVGRRPD